MSRHPLRICEYPGCTEHVRYGHPYPLTGRYCPQHRPDEDCPETDAPQPEEQA